MLSAVDRTLIELNAMQWKFIEAKHEAVRNRCGLGPVPAAARLNELLDNPEALAEYPTEIRRLGRLRDARRAARLPE